MGTMNSAQRDALSSMEGKSTRQIGLIRTMESTSQMKRWRKHVSHYGVDNNMKSEKGKKEYKDAIEKKYGKGIVNVY